MANLSTYPDSFQILESEISDEQNREATNLLGFQYLEEQPVEVASVLRRLPCLSKPLPECLRRQLQNSARVRLPDGPPASSQKASPASITSDASSQSNISTPLSTSRQKTITLVIEKKPKVVRFVNGVEDNEYKKEKNSRRIVYLKACRERQELFEVIAKNVHVTQAILCLSHAVISKIINSLNGDLGRPLAKIASLLHDRQADACKRLWGAPLEDPKEALLRFLDKRANKLYLCRNCNIFHYAPIIRSEATLAQLRNCCASQYVIGHCQTSGRLFDFPFSFSHIQFAMKLFRHGMFYAARLKKPLNCPTIDLQQSYSHLRTSDAYPASDRLLNRTQHWYHTSPDTKHPLSKEDLIKICRTQSQTPTSGVAILCQHLYSYKHEKELWDFQNEENNPTVRRCQQCALEYRYDGYDVGGHGSGIVLSIWRDLGRCLTPFDPRWTAHFEEYKDSAYIKRYKKELRALTTAPNSKEWTEQRWHKDMEPAASEAPVGEIQKMFEDSDGFDLQECIQVMLNPERRQVSFEKVREWRKKRYDSNKQTVMVEILLRNLDDLN